MKPPSELRITRTAVPSAAASIRDALRSFLRATEVDEDRAIDIVTAIGEALANAIEHAYDGTATPVGDVMLYAYHGEGGSIQAEVSDRGAFKDRPLRPDRGFGLQIVQHIARNVTVETDEGTSVRMVFPA